MASNALIELTKERISDNNKLQTFIEKAKAVTIPLFPETVQFTDSSLKFGAAIVSVDTTLDQYGNNRDIYKNESGGYCLHLTKLNEIAQQSGLQITDSRVLERKVDEKGRVTYIEHQVKWMLRSIDGSIKEGVATGKYDYFRDYESMRDKDGKPREKQINGRRKHAEALAESNALTRAYNKAIAKLPQGFTLDELKKPFLIPYVIEDKEELLKQLPAETQNKVREDLVRSRLNLSNQIYGPPPQRQIENAEIIEEQSAVSGQQSVGKKINKEEENKILANEFRQATQEERTNKILNLIKLKGWKHSSGAEVTAAMIEKATLDTQIDRIEMLLNIAELEPEVSL